MEDLSSKETAWYDIEEEYVYQPELIINGSSGSGVMSNVGNFIKGVGKTILGAVGAFLGMKYGERQQQYPVQQGVSMTTLIIFIIALLFIFMITRK